MVNTLQVMGTFSYFLLPLFLSLLVPLKSLPSLSLSSQGGNYTTASPSLTPSHLPLYRSPSSHSPSFLHSPLLSPLFPLSLLSISPADLPPYFRPPSLSPTSPLRPPHLPAGGGSSAQWLRDAWQFGERLIAAPPTWVPADAQDGGVGPADTRACHLLNNKPMAMRLVDNGWDGTV